jgi:hypothetical protein
MEAHPGAMEVHPGAMEAHPGALEAHTGDLCDKKLLLENIRHSNKVKMCWVNFCN